MRNREREIRSREEIEAVIQSAQVCRVGFSDNNVPYIVPMDFGFKDNHLYFHCATKGKKLDIIRKNKVVCFEIDIDHQMVKPTGKPCGWSAKYRSVIGLGKASVVEAIQNKSKALNVITQHYGGDWYPFNEEELERLSIIQIEIVSMTGKKAGY